MACRSPKTGLGGRGGIAEKLASEAYRWDLARHLQSRKPHNPEKSQKSLPRGVWDPPTPNPQKVPKKVGNVQKIVKINYFLDLSDLFRNFLGVRGRGVPNSSRETFLRLFGVAFWWFRGFGFCRWSERSQAYRATGASPVFQFRSTLDAAASQRFCTCCAIKCCCDVTSDAGISLAIYRSQKAFSLGNSRKSLKRGSRGLSAPGSKKAR